MKKVRIFGIVLGFIFIISLFFFFSRSVSREVLETFDTLNERLDKVNDSIALDNEAILNKIKSDTIIPKETMKKIESLSTNLHEYLKTIKEGSLATVAKNDYERMGKSDYFDHLFFKGDSLTDKGKEFLSKIEIYREGMKASLSDMPIDLKNKIDNNFGINPIQNRDGEYINWLLYHFKGFPLIASITKLTQMQSDVKYMQRELLQAIISLK